jgi:hypothetical protein
MDTPKQMPKGVIAVAQQLRSAVIEGRGAIQWQQSSDWFISGPAEMTPEEQTVLRERSYKIAFRIGRLLLLATWWGHDGWHFVCWHGIHRILWPGSKQKTECYKTDLEQFPWTPDHVRSITGTAAVPRNAQVELRSFTRSLSVRHSSFFGVLPVPVPPSLWPEPAEFYERLGIFSVKGRHSKTCPWM